MTSFVAGSWKRSVNEESFRGISGVAHRPCPSGVSGTDRPTPNFAANGTSSASDASSNRSRFDATTTTRKVRLIRVCNPPHLMSSWTEDSVSSWRVHTRAQPCDDTQSGRGGGCGSEGPGVRYEGPYECSQLCCPTEQRWQAATPGT